MDPNATLAAIRRWVAKLNEGDYDSVGWSGVNVLTDLILTLDMSLSAGGPLPNPWAARRQNTGAAHVVVTSTLERVKALEWAEYLVTELDRTGPFREMAEILLPVALHILCSGDMAKVATLRTTLGETGGPVVTVLAHLEHIGWTSP